MCKNKCVFFNEIILLIIMKMSMKMKNGSHRYSMYRTRPRHGYKYNKYKMWTTFEAKFIKKVKQHWGWVEKKCCL